MSNLEDFLAAGAGIAGYACYTEDHVLRAYNWDDDQIQAIQWLFKDLRSRSDDDFIESESNADLVEQVDGMYLKYLTETKLVDALFRARTVAKIDQKTLVSELESYIEHLENCILQKDLERICSESDLDSQH